MKWRSNIAPSKLADSDVGELSHASNRSRYARPHSFVKQHLSKDEALPARHIILIACVMLCGCKGEDEYSDQDRRCIAKNYSNYDPKQVDQCVKVCIACMKGNTVTCTTSCKLKGAR